MERLLQEWETGVQFSDEQVQLMAQMQQFVDTRNGVQNVQ